MALLDRFRNRPPAAPVGESGRMQRAGILVEDDHNPELTGLAGLRELDRMHRGDADAQRSVRMVSGPIAAATWTVIPFGGDEALDADKEVAELVEWALFEHLGWRAHLSTALDVALSLGHAPFEQLWSLADHEGRSVWACELQLRLPRSLHRFDQDERGNLTAVHQMTSSGIRPIPAQWLVWYRLGARGDNWRGQSLLRGAYKHFSYKEKLELIDLIAQERFAVGTPIAYPPASASDSARQQVADVLAQIRTHESGYIVSPWPHAAHAEPGAGALFEILQPSAEHDMGPSLKYHSDKIAASVLQEFMRLGQSGVGARATADVQADPFMDFVEVLAGVLIEDPVNEQLIPRLVALNFPAAKGLPKLRASVIDQTSTSELVEAIGTLVEKRAIVVDDTLEAWIRERVGLPAADPESARELPEPAPPGEQPEKPGDTEQDDDEPQKLALRRSSRPLRGWESLMALDRIEASLDGARQRLVDAAQPVTHRIAAEMAAAPKRRPPAPDELAGVVAAELGALYWTGRDTVRSELQAQRPQHRSWSLAAGEDEIPPELGLRAQAAAENVIAQMARAIRRDVLARSATSQATMQAAAEAAARGALRDEAQQHASVALGAGRAAEADAHADEIVGARYTSILDGNRCSSCAAADDDVLRPLDDPVRLERIPPNPACDGGDRCRCMEFFQLADELAPSA